MITVFTPTYNRSHTLNRLYESLCRQSSFDFEWLVVDDGSTDRTKEYFSSLSENRFAVTYVRQENGGKHRAINRGVKLARGEWFFIVDSDDYLSDEAIETLQKHLTDIENDEKYCGVVGLRVYHNGTTIGTPCNYDVLDTDFLSYRYKYKIRGDRAEVVRTEIIKAFPFPEIAGEFFCTEAVVWNRIAQKYLARYINAPIYICEYLPGGLTDTYKKIMCRSPRSSFLYYKELISYHQVHQVHLKYKLATAREYFRYRRLVNSKDRLSFQLCLLYLLLPFYKILKVICKYFRR